MRASSLFGFGFFVMWFIYLFDSFMDGDFDSALAGEYDWNINFWWLLIIIILILIWRRFDKWLDNRYEVVRRDTQGWKR